MNGVEEEVASEGDHANPCAELLSERCNFWIRDDRMTTLPNFGDVGQGSSRVITGDVIRDCLKVVLGLPGKNTSHGSGLVEHGLIFGFESLEYVCCC